MSEAEKTEKLPKPIEKVIWLAVSCAIAVAGYFLKTSSFKIPLWLGIVYSLVLMTTMIIAAQKVSAERTALAGNKEKKFGYALKTILYYVYIIIAVVFVFMCLWVTGILSI